MFISFHKLTWNITVLRVKSQTLQKRNNKVFKSQKIASCILFFKHIVILRLVFCLIVNTNIFNSSFDKCKILDFSFETGYTTRWQQHRMKPTVMRRTCTASIFAIRLSKEKSLPTKSVCSVSWRYCFHHIIHSTPILEYIVFRPIDIDRYNCYAIGHHLIWLLCL